jgi:hypothetical protein
MDADCVPRRKCAQQPEDVAGAVGQQYLIRRATVAASDRLLRKPFVGISAGVERLDHRRPQACRNGSRPDVDCEVNSLG